MSTHVFGWGFLAAGCCGLMIVLAGAGLLLFFLLRKKTPPSGFDVLPKE